MDGEMRGGSDKKRVTPWDGLMEQGPDSIKQESAGGDWSFGDETNKQEQGEAERKFVKFEELEPIFTDKTGIILGHGTASSGNDHDVVEAILTEGLRGFQSLGSQVSEVQDKDEAVGSTDLRDNAIGLSDPYSDEPVAMSHIKDQLDHWKHRDAENVILIRLPLEFISNPMLGHKQFTPFFTQKRDETGQMRNYLDPRLIVGNYNRETGLVEMNKKFQPELTDEFRSELSQRYEKLVEEAEEEMEKFNMPGSGDLIWQEAEKEDAGEKEEEEDAWSGGFDDFSDDPSDWI